MAKKLVKKEGGRVDKNLIDEAVSFINESANRTVYKGYLEIGNYILKHFFNDDIELASSRSPSKEESFKALSEREDLAIGYTTLTMTVRVAAQEKFFIENKIEANKLSYTHKAELVRIKDDKEKIKLAKKTISKNLSTRKLAEEITKIKKSTKKELPLTTAVRTKLRSLDGLFEKAENVKLPSLSELEKMREKTRAKLKEDAESMLERIKSITEEYNKFLKKIEEIEKKEEKEAA